MRITGINNLYLLALLPLIYSCSENKSTAPAQFEGELAGGETTVFLTSSQAFGTPAPNLEGERLEKHLDGDLAFENSFVSHPSELLGGLGPVFNNNSCVACHPDDGRPAPPTNPNEISGFFLRLSMPGADEHNGPMAVPGFGTQLQNQAIYGVEKEAAIAIVYEEIKRVYADGTEKKLKKPIYSLESPYIPFPAEARMSPRNAPPVFGLGLLEAVPEKTILSMADEHDSNNDGISGKPNYVWDPVSKTTKLGRFGWKAGTPSLFVQSAAAYNQDMGITNSLFNLESAHGQSNSDTIYNDIEVSDRELEDVVFYTQTLGVPAPRNTKDIEVVHGQQIFKRINCASCHAPSLKTGILEGVPEVSNQVIHAYTDMLLHDMGTDLADDHNEFEAEGSEWRTPPLWGIGLTKVVNGHTNFLHDGRANSIEEAILWHGGEAEKSRNDFMNLSKSDRNALLKFLESL